MDQVEHAPSESICDVLAIGSGVGGRSTPIVRPALSQVAVGPETEAAAMTAA